MSETAPLFKPGEMPVGPRPTWRTAGILAEVVDKLLPEVINWLGKDYRPSEHDEIAQQLREALAANWEDDGYKIVRYLDRQHHWECDGRLVEILDDAGFMISKAHDERVRQWVADSGIKPALALGQEVTVTVHGHAPARGTVRDIKTATGQYTVHVPEHGHKVSEWKDTVHYGGWIVDWENLEAEQRLLKPEIRPDPDDSQREGL